MDREQFKLQLEIKKLTESIDRVRLDVSELKSGLRALREEFDDMKQEREEWREAHP
jgi:FtsZ-binding cell division protein ZapB